MAICGDFGNVYRTWGYDERGDGIFSCGLPDYAASGRLYALGGNAGVD
jgi:hypothetical protein